MTGALRCRFIQVLVTLTMLCVQSCGDLQCNWVTQEGQKLNPYIPGDPKNVILDVGMALHECRMKCVEEHNFICASVNYQDSNRMCELLEENDQTASPSTESNYQYSIRPLCAGFWQPWFAHKGKYIDTEENQQLHVAVMQDLRSCMSRCVQHLGSTSCSFIVVSTLTSIKTCELVGTPPDSNSSLQIKSSTQWQFFRRPNWYHDNAPGCEDTTVEKREDRGSAWAILLHKKLEADGYLVAWQYYTRSSGNPCPTYAGVWKELTINAPTRWELKTEALLSEGSPDSVVFHFITGAINRVTQRYALSAFVRDSQGCDGSLISFGNAFPNAYVGTPAELSGINDIGDILITSYSEPRALSLRPFIAEYLVVSEPCIRIPQVGSEATLILLWDDIIGYQSLRSGQQDITGGGIQLTCFTNDTFSNGSIVPCVSGTATSFLYPISTRSVILSLPNYTQPYYVRIEVVRNFNGNELVDGKNKHLGPVCARRPMLEDEDVEVSESGILKAGHNRTHRTRLKTSSLNDSCIKSVISVISDEHGEQLAHASNTTTEWIFEKSEGSHFIISIKANLFSDYQQTVWTGNYETTGAPEAPADFKATERLTNSLKMEWDAINNYQHGHIINYQVDCMVLNASFYLDVENHTSDIHPKSLENLTLYTGTEEVTTLQVNGLAPQVQYKCLVKALLDSGGYGHRASLSLWTKPIYPALDISSTSVQVYNSYAAIITLPNVKIIDNFVQRFGKIWIVVQREGTMSNEDLNATTKLTIDGIRTYVTAILDLGESNNSFTVGDGQMYGGTRNKVLGRGDYTIFVGYKAHTETEVTEFYQLNETPLTVEGEGKGYTTVIVVLVIVILVPIAAVAVKLVMNTQSTVATAPLAKQTTPDEVVKTKKRRRTKQNQSTSKLIRKGAEETRKRNKKRHSKLP